MLDAFKRPLLEWFPRLFSAPNLSDCRVMEEDGKVVTHVGMVVDQVSLFGCALTAGCVGAVSTLEAYRGRGYAGACFARLVEHARDLGCDFLLISGARSLYLRAGCRKVGLDYQVEMTPQRAGGLIDGSVAVRRATVDDIPTMDALHKQESVHWDRQRVTWDDAFNEQTCFAQWGWQLWVASEGGRDVAYFAAEVPREVERAVRVLEYAGGSEVAIRAFAKYASEQRGSGILWKVSGADAVGRQLAEDADLHMAPDMSHPTVLVTNVAQMIARMRPYLVARAGESAADALDVGETGDGAVVMLGGESLQLPTASCVGQFVFGTREERPTPPPTSGQLGEVYATGFPLPTPEYGLNFV